MSSSMKKAERLVAVRAEVRASYVDRIFSVDVDDVGWEDGLCGGGGETV